ncbi:MAG: hypothetical protein IE909_18075 [Campylobacterales bacterium]|nr:hypothetical protein [Campylobacterales bacterium]
MIRLTLFIGGVINAQSEWEVKNQDGLNSVIVIGKISYVIDTNIKYWSLFFPQESTIDYIKYILSLNDISQCHWDGEISQTISYVDSPEEYSFKDFHFTKQIYIYIDQLLTKEQIDEIQKHSRLFGFNTIVRDNYYVQEKAKKRNPFGFYIT